MNIGDEYKVSIEKLSNLGFGIARIDGIVVFVENACVGDELKIKITQKKKAFTNAIIVDIINPSQHRIEPFCPMQKVCGACQLQFIDYDYQLQIKREIVKDTLHSIGGIDIEIPFPIKSPEIKEYRCKVQYPIGQTKVSKKILAGYYKQKSHEIVNIKYCPIQPRICDDIINFIREKAFEFGVSGYNEKKHIGDLRHVVIRHSKATNKNLVILVVNAKKSFKKVEDLANSIYSQFKDVCGVCLNFNPQKTNLILTENSQLVVGKDFVKERILDKTFRIGTNSFFQVNPKSAENIFAYVKDYIKLKFENPTLLDAYAGVTTFGIVLSDVCKKVVSVEECKEAVSIADELCKLNKIDNVELHNMDAEKFFKKELNTKKRKFDVSVIDPPRKGSTEKTLEYLLSLTKNKIIYVSCNPATLARDLKYLISKGAKIESIQPFDMFCHTYHIENVAIIDVKEVNK
ncbi:MAG: 23S rRNA (uracil(1939)-C(5))-methyltransferase RlmD [Candidatus Gastranaerophilaceae bacterium]